MSLRMQIVWDVLERAKDAGDMRVIAACRALIIADRGARWSPDDWRLVRAFADD